MNSIGTLYRLTSFGESHGMGIGGVIDGLPAGIKVDTTYIQQELARRRPGQSALTTSRQEIHIIKNTAYATIVAADGLQHVRQLHDAWLAPSPR